MDWFQSREINALKAELRAQKSQVVLATASKPSHLPPPQPTSLLPGGTNLRELSAKVKRSVVNIATKRIVQTGARFDPFGLGFVPERREVSSLGSGVIVSSDGLVITNHHVIKDANSIMITLSDNRVLEASHLGSDPNTDLALLKITDTKPFEAIQYADSNQVQSGDVVLAVGNPLGVGQTVTMGIVSAVARSNLGITEYENFIQTDAAINPGNSGGALVDMNGHLIGINTAILSQSGGNEGIGLAIPASMVEPVIASIQKFGRVVRGRLGIAIEDVSLALANKLGIAQTGAHITNVEPNSPAAKGGLLIGDVIISIDGEKLSNSQQLRNIIATKGAGNPVVVHCMRAGVPTITNITLEELPVPSMPQRH